VLPIAQALNGQQKYKKIRDINTGSYGAVALAVDRTTNEQVAIKLMERGSKITKYVERELINHSHLLHPHIVQFREVFLTPDYLGIAMEYAAGGDMFQHVTNKRGLSEDEARWFFQQLILGLDYCHKMGVVNRDIKLENTLLDGSRRPLLKICDFGYSKHEKDSLPKSKVGTPGYTAPEIISNKKHYDGKQADVWSAGVMLYVMLFCEYPFERPSDRNDHRRFQKILQRILKVDYTFPPNAIVSPECKDLLARILIDNPDKRITVQQILRHPWYQKGLPPGVVEMNNTCLQLQQGGDAMQTAEQIRHVVNAAKIPSINARYDADDTGVGLVGVPGIGGIGDPRHR
jgi:serine/threonine-protein kinase SRK2